MLKIILLSCICTVLQAQGSQLKITVTNIRTNQGVVRIALCDHPDQFPDHPTRYYDYSKQSLKDSSFSVVFRDLSDGSYAVAVLDDENGNDRMDYELLRIPREGYGFSNDVKPKLKRPPFDKCTFHVREGDNHLVIRMQYFGKKKVFR